MAILDIKNLCISFTSNNKSTQIINNISIKLDKGRTYALVGESGSGKTISALSILKLLPKNTNYHDSKIFYNDSNILESNTDEIQKIRGKKISMIFQEPMTALNPLHKVEKQIKESITIHNPNITRPQLNSRYKELINLTGLKFLTTRQNAYPHQLSGGQRQRVMIAMALANFPEILIADEPTTAIDVSLQTEILNLLSDLQKKLGIAILLITHDLNIVQKIADYTYVIKEGRIIEQGETNILFKKPKHKYTKTLISSKPNGMRKKFNYKNVKQRFEVKSLNVTYTLAKSLLGKPKKILKALQNGNFVLHKGETLGVVGESGSGKSTLALAALRLIKSDGIILFNKTNINQLPKNKIKSYRKSLQIVFQDPFASLNPRMTISSILEEGLKAHKLNIDSANMQIDDILKEVDLDPNIKNRYPHEFSGGQRQRICIARALILNPDVIFFDEPTSALDITTQSKIINMLLNIQEKRQISYVFISHDINLVKSISNRMIIMKDGKIIEQEETKKLYANPKHAYTKKLLKASST